MAADRVGMEDYLDAIARVRHRAQPLPCGAISIHPYGAQVLGRIEARLLEKLDHHLFGPGHHPQGRPIPGQRHSAQTAQALARDLLTAGRELLIAADTLQAKGALIVMVERARQRGRDALAAAAVVLHG